MRDLAIGLRALPVMAGVAGAMNRPGDVIFEALADSPEGAELLKREWEARLAMEQAMAGRAAAPG